MTGTPTPWDPHAALRARVAEIEGELRRALPVEHPRRHHLVNLVAGISMTLTLLDQPHLPADVRGRLEGMLAHEAGQAERVLAEARRPVGDPWTDPV